MGVSVQLFDGCTCIFVYPTVLMPMILWRMNEDSLVHDHWLWLLALTLNWGTAPLCWLLYSGCCLNLIGPVDIHRQQLSLLLGSWHNLLP